MKNVSCHKRSNILDIDRVVVVRWCCQRGPAARRETEEAKREENEEMSKEDEERGVNRK